MTMRYFARIAVPVALGLIAISCGSEGPTGSPPDGSEPSTTPPATQPTTPPAETTVPSDAPGPARPIAMPARLVSTESPSIAGEAVTAFGYEVFAGSAALADPSDNVVVSPLSIAIALAMLEPGATGDAQTQLRTLLRIDDPVAWHASMNALSQELEARVAELPEPSDEQDPGEFVARIANAAFVQPDYPFLPAYLDVVGTNYGAAIEELDFMADQAAAADRINEFIATATDDHITDLVNASDIDPATKLALVNALLLRASWQSQFDAEATVDDEFTLLDGSPVTVPFMHGFGDRSGSGDGWVAASKQLVGNVRLDVVLPDEGRFDEIADTLPSVLSEFDQRATSGAELVVPRFETRVDVALTDVLPGIGLTAPFTEGNLLGIADDPQLVLDKALHQTWLSVDETGIEAAAATVLVMIATSAPALEPVPVVLDRPFLFQIVDGVSGATLFTGRIMDPTS